MESTPDGNGITGWLLGALAALLGVIWTGLRDKLKSHDSRLNKHAQRLTALDGKTEDD